MRAFKSRQGLNNNGRHFTWNRRTRGSKVFCEFVQHGHGLGISEEDWQCLGYRIEAEGKSVTISGDAIDCSGLDTLAKNTDALVICCYLSQIEMLEKEGELIGEHTFRAKKGLIYSQTSS